MRDARAPDRGPSRAGRLAGLSSAVNPVFRRTILSATHNRLVARVMRRHGMRLGGARFVAGETLEEAVPVLRALNQRGLRTNTTLLGEGVTNAAMAQAVADQYIAILDRIEQEGLQTNVALKLTHLGLDLGEEVAYANLGQIVRRAAELGTFIRIDMEESGRVDPTLRIFCRLRQDGFENVGTVLQSALFRSPHDLEALLPMKPNLRLVKGAYLEPPSVAHQHKADVDRAYLEMAERSLVASAFTAIATHDDRIIEHVIDFTDRHGIGADRFEFQMLYGIRAPLQLELVRRGYRVLVAAPHGSEWYFYLMRRLAERPANVLFLMANLLKR